MTQDEGCIRRAYSIVVVQRTSNPMTWVQFPVCSFLYLTLKSILSVSACPCIDVMRAEVGKLLVFPEVRPIICGNGNGLGVLDSN